MEKHSKKTKLIKSKLSPLQRIKKDFYIYLLILPALILTLIFAYLPMPGLVMAFEDYNPFRGMFGSQWVGFDNIKQIFTMPMFSKSILNTLKISMLSLFISFPAPIILAILINELDGKIFKRIVQSISYLPHFLSWISVVGLTYVLFGTDGFINDIRTAILGSGTEKISFLTQQGLFIPFILGLTVWKDVGWGTVVHLANLSSINLELYEAAEVDGASRIAKLWYITLPHMVPTIMILLIFQMGGLFASNFDLIYGLQNPFIDFDVISTVVYYTGIKNGNYSMATAVGFMEGIVALLLVAIANKISKKVTSAGIW